MYGVYHCQLTFIECTVLPVFSEVMQETAMRDEDNLFFWSCFQPAACLSRTSCNCLGVGCPSPLLNIRGSQLDFSTLQRSLHLSFLFSHFQSGLTFKFHPSITRPSSTGRFFPIISCSRAERSLPMSHATSLVSWISGRATIFSFFPFSTLSNPKSAVYSVRLRGEATIISTCE